MDMILSFMLSILASVIAYYICKWLDGKWQLVASLRSKPPRQNGIKTPQRCELWGVFAVLL